MAEEINTNEILQELENVEPAKVEPIKTNAQKTLRHDKDAVMNSLKFLYEFSNEENYHENLKVVVEYIEDIVEFMGHYKKMAEDTSQLLYDIMTKVEKAAKATPQDHKKKVVKAKKE